MSGWKTVKLADVVERAGTWNPSRSAPDQTLTYIDLGALDQDLKQIIGARELMGSEAPSRARQLVASGDVLVSTVRPNLNGVARVPQALDRATASTGFCVLRARSTVLDGGYLFNWVKAPGFVTDMVSKATGASYPAISDRIVLESRLPLPPLSEQQRIAGVLDRLEAVRAKRRAAIAQIGTLTRAMFLDLFGDPATNPRGWSRVELRHVVDGKYGVKAGPFGSSLRKEEYTTSGYRVYGQEQVIAGRFDIGDYFIGERKFEQLKACAVNEGDVLISLVGSFGKVLVVPPGVEPGIINPRLLKIRLDSEVLTPDFLAAMLTLPSVQLEFKRMAHGGTMGVLNAGALKHLPVVTPPLVLQREYSVRAAAAVRLTQAHRASLVALDELFNALAHRAFRGEL